MLLFSQFLQIFANFASRMVVDIHTHNAQTHAQTIVAVGIHPWRAAENDLSTVEAACISADAIGEIGLDFACEVSHTEQERIFRAQLTLAERHQKAVVLHCVRAFEEVMKILSEYRLRIVIFHGFIGSAKQAQRAVTQGYYLSFGERTFRSPKTIEALRATPLSHIFVETDESATPIEKIYEGLAALRGVSYVELTEAVEANFRHFF